MRGLAVIGLGLALAGCTTQVVQDKENMLAAAGFTVRPANTPERQAQLKRLPAHKFVFQDRNGQVVYLYGDPTVCDCIYIGSEAAYQQYRQMAFQRQIANEHLMAAQMSFDNGWWGPWGPGWWAY